MVGSRTRGAGGEENEIGANSQNQTILSHRGGSCHLLHCCCTAALHALVRLLPPAGVSM